MTSIAFRNVEVLDGLGGQAVCMDVGVENGKIVKLGDVPTLGLEVDGKGCTLAPGFIDTHAHDDGAFR